MRLIIESCSSKTLLLDVSLDTKRRSILSLSGACVWSVFVCVCVRSTLPS